MKLGSQTGSLTNHILSRAVIGQPEPVVGMDCTLLAWTDRHAATIRMVTRSIITVQDDDGGVYHFRKNVGGMWDEVKLNHSTNRWNKTGGYGLRIGTREEYRDPSF